MTDDMLGDKTFAELGIKILRDYDHPVVPDMHDMTINIPGQHGVIDLGAYLESRYFSLPCAIVKPRDSKALQKIARTLAAHILDMYGRP